MKLVRSLLLSLVIISFSCPNTFAQENVSYFLHTIEKGQSLYSIASMYNVSQTDIIKLNPGCEEKIYAGAQIRIPQSKSATTKQTFHTIQPQETLYGLTVKYKISAKAICEANPGLSASNFKIGQVIAIPMEEKQSAQEQAITEAPVQSTPLPAVKPRCRDMHKVKRKETIFSVSREYGITEAELIAANPELKDGMKKGMFLCIPYPSDNKKEENAHIEISTVQTPPSNTELFATNSESNKKISTIKAAVILPFLEADTKSRMIEYYEGLLMAADSLKKQGVSMDLYAYDSGSANTSIKGLLAKKEMKDMNIIFGPMHTQHIKPLAEFAQKNDIRLVIPFNSKDNEVFNNPSIYQVNTPQSYLYSEVYEHFVRKFPNSNVIIIENTDADKDKLEFIKGLKQELSRNGISIKVLKEGSSPETMKSVLSPTKENIFILSSDSNIALIKTLPLLTVLVRENPDYQIKLFGYPIWQTYTKDHLASFYELDTYFYSSFFTNNLFPEAINFTNAYGKWYSKEIINTVPRYGMLGFDTAYFFLKGLSKYGSKFEERINNITVTPLQTGFKFARVNNWGGFINKKVFFVHFSKDYELIKLDFE